jgi:hypothetical protein
VRPENVCHVQLIGPAWILKKLGKRSGVQQTLHC